MTVATAGVLIQNGSVASGRSIDRVDVLVSDGVVSAIGTNLAAGPDVRIIDASGKYVLPGGIDAHAHPQYTDKMDAFSVCAAFGGVTTVIAFVGSPFSTNLVYTPEVVTEFIEESQRTSYLDFAIHGFFLGESETERSIPELLAMGVLSFKFFMSSPRRGMLSTDAKLLSVMEQIADGGGMVMIHAENGFAIDHLVDRYLAEGKVAPEYYLPSHPAYLEAEAAFRAIALARATACPLYLVHLSSREVLRVLRDARAENPNVYGETCPHYLTLTNDELLRRGPLAKVAPPLRESEDVDAMWAAVADGTISVVGSDSTGYQRKHKNLGGLKPVPIDENHPDVEFSGNIFEARYGLNTIEYMMPVVFREAVDHGRLSINRFVEVFSENPAKLFGLYPRKGAIEIGADADIVIWDPTAKAIASASRQHGNADFTTFEGFELLGIPVLTMQRGEIVVEDGTLVGRQGRAAFLARDPQTTAYAPGGNPIS